MRFSHHARGIAQQHVQHDRLGGRQTYGFASDYDAVMGKVDAQVVIDANHRLAGIIEAGHARQNHLYPRLKLAQVKGLYDEIFRITLQPSTMTSLSPVRCHEDNRHVRHRLQLVRQSNHARGQGQVDQRDMRQTLLLHMADCWGAIREAGDFITGVLRCSVTEALNPASLSINRIFDFFIALPAFCYCASVNAPVTTFKGIYLYCNAKSNETEPSAPISDYFAHL